MTTKARFDIDPQLDLVLERFVDVPAELVWQAWTEPEHIKAWFTPRPWQTVDAELDLRPGGIFRTVMRSPEGEEFPGSGCFLEIEPLRKLVWTDALGPGYRPLIHGPDEFAFTAFILLEPRGDGTNYTAIAKHADPNGRSKHEEMGFMEGWGTALDQLVEHVKATMK